MSAPRPPSVRRSGFSPTVGMNPDLPMIPDAVLHYWGEVYLANPRLADHGVPFDVFLSQPMDYLLAIGVHAPPAVRSSSGPAEPFSSVGEMPLLPPQARLATRLDALDAMARRPDAVPPDARWEGDHFRTPIHRHGGPA